MGKGFEQLILKIMSYFCAHFGLKNYILDRAHYFAAHLGLFCTRLDS